MKANDTGVILVTARSARVWFVVTTMIVGASLMELHAENLTSVYNCLGWRAFHVMNVEEDQAAKLSAKIRDDLLSWCD